MLDIETLVDESVWTRGAPRYNVVPTTAVVVSDLPDQKKYVSQGLGAVEVDVVPPPHACRVVAISCLDISFDAARTPRYSFDSCWTDCRWGVSQEEADASEAVLLSAFAHAMETAETDVHLVTWNGRQFDLPAIVMRSMKHKIAAPWYYKNKEVRYRYSTEGHCDLMDFLGDFGATRFMRLGDVARLCGLPGKTDMSGDKVSVLYEEAVKDLSRDLELRQRVARYCLQDVVQTALVFARAHYLRGKIAAETHDALVETFRASPDVLAAIDLAWDRLLITMPSQPLLPGVS